MANYKLVDSDKLDADMTSVADKLREKSETTDKLLWPSGFINAAEHCSSLNFSVVGGTVKPENPKENTIWVNTDKEITGWIFSATEPETSIEGMVWVSTGTDGDVEFNALKKNAIQIYASYIKQYLINAWTDKEAAIYQGSSWIDFISWNGELYNQGDEFSNITGGWVFVKGRTESYVNQGTGTKKATSIYLDCPENDLAVAAVTAKKIDLSDYDTLKCNITSVKRQCRIMVGTSQTMGESGDAYAETKSAGEISLNVSSFNGSYYVAVATWALDDGKGTAYAEFDNVWME